jgi:cytochrome c
MMPAALNTPENLTEGKRLYEAYCSHCHGLTGQADGGVIAKGFPPPPSYTTGKSSRGGDMKDLTDGKIYHTLQYGLNLMGSHASQLSIDERWKIIMFVHELQKAGQPAEATADSTGAKSNAAKSDKKM